MPSNQWLGFGGGVRSQCAVRGNLASGERRFSRAVAHALVLEAETLLATATSAATAEALGGGAEYDLEEGLLISPGGLGQPGCQGGGPTGSVCLSPGSGGALRLPFLRSRRGCEGRRAPVRAPVGRVPGRGRRREGASAGVTLCLSRA